MAHIPSVTRRSFVRGAAAVLAGGLYGGRLSFAEAQAEQAPLRELTREEADLLGALGETLLPGAEAAGIAYFVDEQLTLPPEYAMLVLKYMGWPSPYAAFYRDGLRALAAFSRSRYGGAFLGGSPTLRAVTVGALVRRTPRGWDGPPAPLFYRVVRSDAMDVVYGTVAGFEKLGVPYMPHIAPPTRWSAPASSAGRTPRAASTEEVDAVVVGAGQAGSLIAARLSAAGKKVVVLESGPPRALDDLVSSQIWARRIKWGGPATSGGKDPLDVHLNSGFGFGGAALHHYACWYRLHPEDFEVRTRSGVGLDWPLGYDDLRPHYDRVQADVGISGDAKAEVWRPRGAPYPMPPLPTFKQGALLKKGFDRLGLRTAPLPLAINSTERDGRPACIYDGWCDAGCPTGALANPLVVYLKQAERAGAEIRPFSTVSRVLTNDAGTRATGVEYFTDDGERRVQRAKVVVLAAFAIQTPRILLNSATPKHPDGLANGSGTLGRYLSTHVAGNVWGLFPEETENHVGVSGGQLVCQDGYTSDRSRGFPGRYQWNIAQALKPNDLLGIVFSRTDLWGKDLDQYLHRAAKHLATMVLVGETFASPSNRVELGSTRDRFGLPVARVEHSFAPRDLALFDFAMKEGSAIFEAAGASEVWHGPPFDMHIMGGTLMGKDPERSVTNGFGATHQVPNLFVAGPGLFPSTGGVNPTFTLSALADRTASFMLASWTSLLA